MRLLWLPDVLRAAGLTVHEVSGWRTRGDDSYGPVRGITVHHTAGARTSTDAAEIGVLLHGSATAPPPISQLYLSRTGHWHVVASGLCFHNLVGWGGPNEGYGNDSLLGIEAQHSGAGEPWTDLQYRSYVRGVAALARHRASGYAVTVSRVAGHKEHQPGAKSDPSFDMGRFRADVARVLAGEDDDMPTADEIAASLLRADMGYSVQPSLSLKTLLQNIHQQGKAGFPDWAETAKLAEIRALLAEIRAEVAGVDEAVLAALGSPDMTPAQVAEALRQVLGDRAPEVGALLAGQG